MFFDDEFVCYVCYIVFKEFGGSGQVRLKVVIVVIIGVGGIGLFVIQYFVVVGVGCLILIDDDVVEFFNL